ncbi:serine hydrolase [Streptosporangium soli]|nr:serine hydrolase [Streptosporangium sp. KLBMP 9127]
MLRSLAAAVLAVLIFAGCGGGSHPEPVRVVTSLSPESSRPRVEGTNVPRVEETNVPRDPAAFRLPSPPKIVSSRVTRILDRFLEGRGRVSAMVRDVTTGRTYRYQRNLRLPTASTSKIDILMALLLKTPWRRLGAETRHDATLMIKESDNRAADRLWLRIGGAYGLTKANRRLGLRHTTAIDGRCIDLYCWGITKTSAEDQVKLVSQLVAEKSPVDRADRDQVLRLMQHVIRDQKWGVSAAACEDDVVALKNGWLRHVSNMRWAVVSAGVISGNGHHYAIAVLTEDNFSMEAGIAKIEGVAKRILAAFRGKDGCTAGRLPYGASIR